MTIFNANASQDDQLATALAEVESKFSKEGQLDVEALKKGKAEADIFIERLKAETAAMREDLGKRATLEEIKALIKAQSTVSSSGDTNLNEQDDDSDKGKSVDVEALFAQFEQRQNIKQQKSAQEQNWNYIQSELTKAWGNNYVPKLDEVTKSLGLTRDQVVHLAGTTPKALLAMLNPSPTRQPDHTPPTSSRGGKATSVAGETFAHFEKMRKENPTLYHTPQIQNRMYQLAREKGEDFYKS